MRLRLVTLLSALLFLLLQGVAATAAGAEPSPSPSPTSGTGSAEPTADASPSDEEQAPSDEPTEATPPTEGSYIGVTLKNDAETDEEGNAAPVPDAVITVLDEQGAEIGSATTDVNGKVFIPIPGNGSYTVELDEDSLPEGAELSGDGETSQTVNVFIQGGSFVQFQIGVAEIEGKSFAERLETALLSGLKFGAIIALAALGLSLIFGTTGLTNFAHGELITFGAIVTYIFNVGVGLPVIWAGCLAVLAGALFGWLNDRALWRPLRRRGTGVIAMMIVAIGLGIFLRSLFQYYFGGSTRTLTEYVAQQRRDYGPISLAPKELAIILISMVVIAIVCTAIMKTRAGKAMRAVSDNPALAASSGMRVDGVITMVWVLGTALTALAGVLMAVNTQVNFLMGFKLLLLVFAAVILGGLGTVWGALLGSLVIGLMVETGPLFGVPDSMKDVGALALMILILLVRPQGILGRAGRVG